MGWTSYYREPGESDREHLSRELCGDYLEIVDSVTIKGTFYAAFRYTKVSDVSVYPVGHTFGVVVLQRRTRRDSYGHNYARKEIDETMGPGDIDCPERILDLLSPTDSENALQWRAACRERAAKKAARPTVKKGDVVRFAHPLTFGNGTTLDTLTFVERSIFSSGYQRYRIPSWKDRAFQVVSS